MGQISCSDLKTFRSSRKHFRPPILFIKELRFRLPEAVFGLWRSLTCDQTRPRGFLQTRSPIRGELTDVYFNKTRESDALRSHSPPQFKTEARRCRCSPRAEIRV